MRNEVWSLGEPAGKEPDMHGSASPSARPERAIKSIGETELIWMMAMLMALQAFGIDAILPALDDVAASLAIEGNDRQFIVGFDRRQRLANSPQIYRGRDRREHE